MSAEFATPGTWVLVWGQVEHGKTHPEDITVELFSHNAQFSVDVRRDHIKATTPPPFATQCPSLYREAHSYLRCQHLTAHGGAHGSGSQMWNDMGEAGRIEDAT